MRRTTITSLAAICILFLLGTTSAPPKVEKTEITIEDVQFKPDEVTIKKGQTVKWTNKDNRDHIIIARDQSFKSENLRPKETYEFTFKEAGEFEYSCAYRPRMTGKIIVKDE